MGLYFNDKNHTNMYKNREEVQGKNQKIFVKNHVSEMVKEQERINNSLQQTLFEIRTLFEKQHDKNESKWTHIESQLIELQHFNAHYETVENKVTDYLKKLEKDNVKIQEQIETGKLTEAGLQEELSKINSSYQIISNQLDDVVKAYEQLSLKVDQQIDSQQEQTKSQEKIQKRLDNQEALTEKVIRQMDHFRGLLFERTNYLSEKMDETFSYIFGLLTDKQAGTNFLMYEKLKREEKSNRAGGGN